MKWNWKPARRWTVKVGFSNVLPWEKSTIELTTIIPFLFHLAGPDLMRCVDRSVLKCRWRLPVYLHSASAGGNKNDKYAITNERLWSIQIMSTVVLYFNLLQRRWKIFIPIQPAEYTSLYRNFYSSLQKYLGRVNDVKWMERCFSVQHLTYIIWLKCPPINTDFRNVFCNCVVVYFLGKCKLSMSYAKPYIILQKTAKSLNISHFYTHLSLKKLFQGQKRPGGDEKTCGEKDKEWRKWRRVRWGKERWSGRWVYIIISGDRDLSVRCCITYVLIEHDSLLDSLGSIAVRFVTREQCLLSRLLSSCTARISCS